MRLARLNKKELVEEPIWHIVLAIIITIGLQLTLKNELTFGSKYFVAGLETVLISVLLVPNIASSLKRIFAFLLIGLITIANIISLSLVIRALLSSGKVVGRDLLIASVAIYLTNIIVFGILYSELDTTKQEVPDFDFPQFNKAGQTSWQPTFFDYLYVSVTNATAFSPTDTMPLTHRAKLLMAIQGLIALVTIVLVTARAVNILG